MRRQIQPAPWRTTCPETRGMIKKGEICLWDPLTKKAYSTRSYAYMKAKENESKKRG